MRHREWGFDCPAIDIDFLLVEFDQAVAKAIVELKGENASPINPGHSSYRAIANLADRAGVPFFAVRYANDLTWYHVIPINPEAKTRLGQSTTMTEEEYKSFLYRLRGR